MLRNIPLFSSLTDSELTAIEKVAVKKTFPKNTILLSEGDSTDALYVICEGKVKVTIDDNEGKELILSILGTGEYFGEMALLDDEPRSASVTTKETTQLLIISKNDFMGFFSSNPIALNLLKDLIKRLREANKKIESLGLLDVYGRVARILNQFAKSQEGKMVIEEKLTHQEIANMIGSSREMVSLILKELSNGGYITIDKKLITINKKLPYSW
jgi:CRP/FNR family cyclic AMP-dependent transcriptional regulator